MKKITELYCTGDELGLSCVETISYWGLDSGAITITVTTEALHKGLEYTDVAYIDHDGTLFTQESYTASSGGTVDIIRCEFPAAEHTEIYASAPAVVSYAAHFYANGVRYGVDIASATDDGDFLTLMKDILDAFEFKEIS